MKPAGWLARLDEVFGAGTVIGPELLPIVTAESDFGAAVAKHYAGFFALSSCLQSLVLETLSMAEQLPLAKEPSSWFRPVLLSFASTFRILRAAENLFLKGYSLNAYAVLRDLKDRVIAYGAIINGYISFSAINGWDVVNVSPRDFTIEHFRTMRKARQKADGIVQRKMFGAESGLSATTCAELRKWNDFFHAEVHGGRFTFAIEGHEWLFGNGPLPLEPSFDPTSKADGMFLSHFKELGWLLIRTLPYLQPPKIGFNKTWRKRWYVLDDSFRAIFESNAASDQAVVTAIRELVSTKFDFNPDNTFYQESLK